MAHSRLPLFRRVSQIFFLLLFLALLILTTLRPALGGAGDIHMRAPVRLFFQLDPLVAIANVLAAHALYRGLLLSLVILVPTFFWAASFAAGSARWEPCSTSWATSIGGKAWEAADRVEPV